MSFPIGSIIMWNKTIASRPAGWEHCNGTNGTPDLRGKFVIGAALDTELGSAFGAESHLHSNANAQNAGTHPHDVTGSMGSGASTVQVSDIGSGVGGAAQNHSHVIDLDLPPSGNHPHALSNTGGATNLPPYVQIHYIMRVQ